MPDLAHFKGIAIIVDDECAKEDSEIARICASIRADGGLTVTMTALPPANTDYENFRGASFVVLDWMLDPVDPEVQIPAELEKEQERAKVEFIREVQKHRVTPVFIFTHENVESVNAVLSKAGLISKDHPSHILVRSKNEVLGTGVNKVLNDWIADMPSALTLKQWEKEYESAKNAFFTDLFARDRFWPVFLWKTFDDDDTDPSEELGQLISRSVLSRMTPFKFDLERFLPLLAQLDKAKYAASLLSVIEGGRFVPDKGLHETSIAPGDVFKDGKAYYFNVRPDCDCIARDGENDICLYLLRGKALSANDMIEAADPKSGQFRDRDDEAMVFPLNGGKVVAFKFKTLYQFRWSVLRKRRLGRLLPPFSTRVQQRYSAYLQRPGLPRIPEELLPTKPSPEEGRPQSSAA